MRVPLSWLCDFTPLDVDPDDEGAVARLHATLDGLGLVVESVEHVGGSLPGVVLARVLEINAIEGADRVRQVFVDDGGAEPLEIVCGATNFELGDVVPLATVGTELPGGMVIAERKMRGATSRGMLCSGRELGLSDDQAGLLIVARPGPPGTPLPSGVVPGRRFDAYLGQRSDVVFDLAIEPNRPDCLSIIGVARDLAAKLGLPFSVPEPVVVESERPAEEHCSVALSTPGCSGFVVRVLEGLGEFPSPELVKRRLELAGMRPISAIVDATNYVMLELGQPTHAYDLDRVRGGALGVRSARPGETITTLDGVERVLGIESLASGDVVERDELVITDGSDRPVGIAGVMGGAETEIRDATSRVALESASFDPISVGRTSARLGLRSEASQRFWRGIDPAGLERAADRFCELVQGAAREAGAPVPLAASGRVVVRPEPLRARQVLLRTERVNAVLGTSLDDDAITSLIEPLGFAVSEHDGARVVMIPSWRPDASREADLVEEVARHYGYERIGQRERRSPSVGALTAFQSRRRQLRQALVGAGISEAWTSSIVDPRTEAAVGAEGPFLTISNPIVRDETVLRTGLLGGLLGALARNESHRAGSVRLFEIGRVFGPPDQDGRPLEVEQLGVVVSGPDGEDATAAMRLFHRLVAALRIDPDGFVLEQGEFRPLAGEALAAGAHPTRSALVLPRRADPRTRPVVAVVGEVDPAVLASMGVAEHRVGWLVCSLPGLFGLPVRSPIARPVSRYPSSDLDLAFVLDEEVPAAKLAEQLVKAAGELLVELSILDVYRGEAVPAGTRGLTYRLRLGALDHTLADTEIASVRRRCIEGVVSRLPASLRA